MQSRLNRRTDSIYSLQGASLDMTIVDPFHFSRANSNDPFLTSFILISVADADAAERTTKMRHQHAS
jgi:hypothetical protein